MQGVKRIAGLALMVVICGCGKDPVQPSQPQGTSQKTLQDSVAAPVTVSNDSPVAIRINGRDLTRQEIIRNGRVMLTLNLNKRRQTKLAKRDWKYLNSYCTNTERRELGRAAVAAYLSEHGIVASSDDIQTASKTFVRRYGVRSRKLKRWHTIDDLKYMLGKDAFRVDCEVRDLANFNVATNAMIHAADLHITDQMVAERMKSIGSYNRRMSYTNQLIFARATNVWQQIVAKTIGFEEAAEKYTEDKYAAYGIDWGSFSKEQLDEEPGVLALLPTLKVGDITPPVESDGGLAILRRDEEDNPDLISLSRIFFRLPFFYEIESPEELRATMKAEKEHELVQKTLTDYVSRLKVEYPDGTNVMSSAVTVKEFQN